LLVRARQTLPPFGNSTLLFSLQFPKSSLQYQTMEYKRDQIEEAIFRTFGAGEERRNELKFPSSGFR
jgi:hypothetical protein